MNGSVEEIEVTPEMIEAGIQAIRDTWPDWTDLTRSEIVRLAVERIYRAMLSAR